MLDNGPSWAVELTRPDGPPAITRACVGAILNGSSSFTTLPLHKSCFNFFRCSNLLSYLLILGRVLLCFIQSQVARTTCLTSFFHCRRTNLRWPRPRSNFYFFHISVFRSERFVNKFSDNETERFVTSSRLVGIFSFLVEMCERRGGLASKTLR